MAELPSIRFFPYLYGLFPSNTVYGINYKNTDIYNYIDATFCQLENKLSLHGVQ